LRVPRNAATGGSTRAWHLSTATRGLWIPQDNPINGLSSGIQNVLEGLAFVDRFIGQRLILVNANVLSRTHQLAAVDGKITVLDRDKSFFN